MAATPAPKNTVHSVLPDSPSSSTSSTNSTSTLQYINAQIISHGFATSPGLSLDGLSSADAESVTKCLLSMLSQRVEDMTRAEELTTKLRTLSYDHERLRTMHGTAVEVAECAEREVAAARAKLTIANRAQTQAEAAHKQTMGDLQRGRAALLALRATHVAEIKRREKEFEAMRERWSKIADAQLKIGGLASGMTVVSQPANASVLLDSGAASATVQKGLVESVLEEAEKASALLREENKELKTLVVDAANAVRKVLHKAVSSDPDDLEFPPAMTAIDLFPLGAPDAAFERFSALLTTLRDTLATLRASETPAAGPGATLTSKPPIPLADLAKKAAESDAKAHKWEIEELRTTIAGLRDELRKVKGERKLIAPTSRVQDFPAAHDELASHLPQTDELKAAGPALESQQDLEVTNFELNSKQVERDLFSTKPAKRTPAPTAAQPGPSRLSPRKTRSKSKAKLAHKSPLKVASASTKRSGSGSRPRRLTSKRVEASFETEVIPSTVSASLLPTSFVLPPPSPESRLPAHPASLLAPFAPPLFPASSTTTPPFSPHAQLLLLPPPPTSSSSTSAAAIEMRVTSAELPPPTQRPFPIAKPLGHNMSHAYSPAKPSPLSRILMLADSPEGTATGPAALQIASTTTQKAAVAAPIFEPPPVLPPSSTPATTDDTQAVLPAPLRTGTTSNAAGAQRGRSSSKRTSLEAQLDHDADADADTNVVDNTTRPKPTTLGTAASPDLDVVTRDPRAPEKENTIRRRLKGGPAAVSRARSSGAAAGHIKTRKMAAAAAKSQEAPKSSVPADPVMMGKLPVAEVGHMGGAAGRLLAAARGAGAGAGAGQPQTGVPRRVPVDSTEAGLPTRRVS